MTGQITEDNVPMLEINGLKMYPHTFDNQLLSKVHDVEQ